MSLPDFRQIANQINANVPDFGAIASEINNDPLKIARDLNRSIVDTDDTPLSFLEFLQAGEFLTAGITQSLLKGIPIGESIAQKHTFSDIVDEQFPELSRGQRMALGFGMSILFDPLTYVGIGTLTKAGKAAQIARKLASTPAQQAALGQRALIKFAGKRVIKGEAIFKGIEKGGQVLRAAPVTGKIITKGEELFAPQRRLKKFFPEFQSNKLKFTAKTQDEILEAIEKSDAIEKLIPDLAKRQELMTISELTAEEALILGRRVANDKEMRVLQIIDAVSSENERRLLESGLLTKEWVTGFKKKFGLQHRAHIKTPITLINAIRGLGKKGRGGVDVVKQTKIPGLEYKRELQGTAEEINRQFGKYFFETDVAKVLKIESINVAEAVNATDYLRGIATNPIWAKEAAKTSAGKFIAEEGFSLVNHPAFLGKQVPKEIAADIRGMVDKLSGLNIQGDFLNVYDSIQNTWKAWTLGVFPAYHSRNLIGNIWLNYLGDVNPLYYKDAIRMQITQTGLKGGKIVSKAMGLKPGSITTKAGLVIDDKEVMRQAKRLTVVGRGIYGVDIPLNTIEKARRGNSIILGEETIFLRAGFGIGKSLEDNARLAHFIDRIVKGFSYEDAAISTKKFLFDYTELSRFEKNVMKRIFPFYTWARKNIPLEIEKLIQQPGKFAVVPKIREAVEESQGGRPNSVFMSDFLKDNFAIRTRKVGAQEQFFLLKNWLPATDLLELFAPIDLAGEMVTPLAKAPAQWLANYNFFFKSQIEKTPGELGEFLGRAMKKKTIDLLRNIRLLNTIDRLNPGNVFGTDRTFRLDLPQKQRWATFLTGLKIYANDEEKAIMWFNFKLRKAIGERITSLRKAQRRRFDPEIQRLLEEIQNIKSRGAAALATQ